MAFTGLIRAPVVFFTCFSATLYIVGCKTHEDQIETSKANASNPPVTTTHTTPSMNSGGVSWNVPVGISDATCSGKRFGTYTWDMSYFRDNNSELMQLLDSDVGRLYACGDLYLNVADYSSPDVIPNGESLIELIKEYRAKVGNPGAVVYLTYGDVTARDGAAMITFTKTFFDWVMQISPSDAALMGRIGISYDVEHVNPEDSKAAMLLSRKLRMETAFGQNIFIQHTIDGDRNILTTEYVMRYADSALAMLYSNTATGLVDLITWLLTEQCEKCLDDEYSRSNFQAKISIIVEASCKMGKGCSEKSMCVKDADDEGMAFIERTVEEANQLLSGSGVLTRDQFIRLFNLDSQWVIHNFEWERCYSPFNKYFSFASCKDYHLYAKSCRDL